MTNLEKALEEYAKDLVNEIKKEIVKAGAVKTGNMLKSVDYKIFRPGEGPQIKVDAIYYYEYVDKGTTKIRAREFTKKAYETVRKTGLKKLTKAYKKDVEEKIKKEIDK